ncbi:MAG: hypothetical protein HDR34_00355 [Treponema sp.]|nr:hypothetical protein [Treponema sp.]
MYRLSSDTKSSLQVAMAFRKDDAKLVFSKKRDLRKVGRGNPLLSRRRFRTIEEVDSGLDALEGLV